MGFWDSLKQSAASIGGYVINNAGSIAKAIETVASIVPVAEDGNMKYDGNTNALTTLYNGLQRNESAMLKQAEQEFVPDDSAVSSGSDWSGPYSLPALWPNPPVGATTIPAIIASDIHKFLALSGLPSTISSFDLGQIIAKFMFSNSKSDASQVKTDGAKNPFPSVPFTITHRDFTIKGGHVWYAIPMGSVDESNTAELDSGAHVSWHSLLYFHVKTSSKMKSDFIKTEKQLAILQQLSDPPSGPYNASTIQVTWTGARPQIKEIMAKAIASIYGDKTKKIKPLKAPISTGTTYTYQFSSPINIGPGVVSGVLSDAITDQLSEVSKTTELPVVPEVEVVNRQCIIPSTSGNVAIQKN